MKNAPDQMGEIANSGRVRLVTEANLELASEVPT